MKSDLVENADIQSADATGSVEIARAMLQRLFGDDPGSIGLELADGTMLFAREAAPRSVIVARRLDALRSLVVGPASAAAARAVVVGDLDVRGDVEYAIAQIERISERLRARDAAAIIGMALRLPAPARAPAGGDRSRAAYRARGRKHSLARDSAAIAYHYDVSNDFYALWLDSDMVYSCAYFRDGSETIDRAQHDKLDLICRKLRLRPGHRLLDVGCGWGGLVRFAAREYGVRAVGITLSTRQAEYARQRIEREHLADRCTIELRDYRDLAPLGPFDRAASIGMVEHVGIAMLPLYFRSIYDALEPGGLFLNHGISSQRSRPRGIARVVERVMPKRSTFIERYVFPDGDLPRLDEIVVAAEAAGFEVRDIENLREHYARTLRHWVRRLEANESAARTAVGDETYNVWRFYMSGSAHGFAVGRMGLDQTLLVKRLEDGTAPLPSTRDDLYVRST